MKLWDHQKEAVDFATNRKCCAFYMEAGTGKTAAVIYVLRKLYKKEGGLLPTLILAPSIVLKNWENEIRQHGGDVLPANVLLLRGDIKKRAREMLTANKDIVITNYEALINKTFLTSALHKRIKVLVLDESHRIKNPAAKISKAAISLADIASYKFLLSGSPILNSQLDLWAQLRALGQAKENFYSWRAKYFYDGNARMPANRYFPNWIIQPNAEKELKITLEKCSFIKTKAECLDLPPLVRKVIHVPLLPEQAKVYRDMEKDFIATVNAEKAVSTTVITKLLRLQQICSGILPLTTSDTIAKLPTAKLSALRELLEELLPHHKVIIWNYWRAAIGDITKVIDLLGYGYCSINGETKAKDRDSAIDEFQNDASCRALIGNQAAGGIGINLTAASYAIYFSKTHNLEHDIQSEARNYRGGSEIHEKITRIDIVTEGTIEEEITECLSKKQKIGERLLQWKQTSGLKQDNQAILSS